MEAGDGGIAGAAVIGKGNSASVEGSAGVDALAALLGWPGCNTGGKAEKGCHTPCWGSQWIVAVSERR